MLALFAKFLTWLRRPNVGADAESLAATWLRRERGFSLVTRNWRNPHDRRQELDLVCRDQQVLVFVEVKARAASALVPGYHAVDARKKRALLHAIRSYLHLMPKRPLVVRFDDVEISLPAPGTRAKPEVLHFENVPLFGKEFR
jgi:putative endonuclease